MQRYVLVSILVGATVVGCSSTPRSSGNKDGGTSMDLASLPSGMDLASASNCNATKRQFVADTLTLPSTGTASEAGGFGFDFNGDEMVENKLGALLAVLNGVSGAGQKPQDAVDAAITPNGTFLLLMALRTDSLVDSDCSSLTVGTAKPKMNADFSGSGTFALAGTPSTLTGGIASSVLATANPVSTTTPFAITVELPLVPGSPPVELNLTSAYVTGTLNSAGDTITGGRIHGVVKNSDLRTNTLPGIAAALTAILQSPTGDPTTQAAISQLLDKGNCTTGTATAGDDIIAVCELTDGTLKSSFTPDVDLYSDTSRDADGNVIGDYATYQPKPSTTTSLDNDCLSFGLGFTAVGAVF